HRGDRGGRSFERRDGGDRGGFRRDDRPGHRGSDRPFNRDRQGDRPGFRPGGHDRPNGRRDDHRGGGSFQRREDKPRWKRNG
ncbi:RNA helicase, partial [Streptomyces althioticus]